MKSHKIINTFIVFAAVLLIGMLALPAFADTENGKEDPVIVSDPDLSEDLISDETPVDADTASDVTEPSAEKSEDEGKTADETLTVTGTEDGSDEDSSGKEENSGKAGSSFRRGSHHKHQWHRSKDSDSRGSRFSGTEQEREKCRRDWKKGTVAEPEEETETEGQKDPAADTDTAADADKTGTKHGRSFRDCRCGQRYHDQNGSRSNSGDKHPMKEPSADTGYPSDEDHE